MGSSDLRSSRFIWWVRLAQLVFGIATLAIVANSSATWGSFDCNIPQRVAYTLACVSSLVFHVLHRHITLLLILVYKASITLPLVIYLLFTTGRFERGFWRSWAQLGIDIFLAVLWIAAAALSAPDCGDICNACSAGGSEVDAGLGFDVWGDSFACYCYFPGIDYKKRSMAAKLLKMVKRSLLRPRASSAGRVAETAASIGAKQGFEGVLMYVLPLVSKGLLGRWLTSISFFFVLTFISGLSIQMGWARKRHNASPTYNAEPEKGAQQPARHDQEVDTAGNVVEGLN